MSSKRSVVLLSTLLLPLLVALFLLIALHPPIAIAAPSTIITVNTLIDENDGSCVDSDCSLRDAIAIANVGDSIIFNVAGNVVLSSTPNYLGELIIDKSLTINGSNVITISGNNATRVFKVISGNVMFDSLTIANGKNQGVGCGIQNCSGGILVQNATVTVTNSTIISNTADYGAGIHINGGRIIINSSTISENSAVHGGSINIYDGTVIINDSVISGNSASLYGGGMYIRDNTTVVIRNSTISGNFASSGGGIINRGIMTVSHSSIVGNSTVGGGGGAIHNEGVVTVNNSTISGNVSKSSGGGIANGGTVMVSNSTITNNSVRTVGGGIYNYNDTGSIHTTITNTLVSGNFINTPSQVNDLEIYSGSINSFSSGGYNLIGTVGAGISAFIDGFNGDQTGIYNPQLSALADNGGLITSNGQANFTHALLPGSPAINAGNSADCPVTDQRGILRVEACDIGAFESRGFTFSLFSGTSQTTTINTTFANPLMLTVSSIYSEPVEGGSVIFVAPTTGASVTFTETIVTVETNGLISLPITANDIIGSYIVSADMVGNTGISVTYALANSTYAIFLPVVIK